MGPMGKGIFLTKGVGKHREKLTSFELALRDARLAEFNLVRVSSIFPPGCKVLSIPRRTPESESGTDRLCRDVR
jgi:arginine decarboxylase